MKRASGHGGHARGSALQDVPAQRATSQTLAKSKVEMSSKVAS